MPVQDLPRLTDTGMQELIKNNRTDLQTLLEIIVNETRIGVKKISAVLGPKLDSVREMQQSLCRAQLEWEAATRQQESMKADIERAARERLQHQVKQQEADSEKALMEARCATMMQELANLNKGKERLKAETKYKWEKLTYVGMCYKQRLSCHISLDAQDEHAFTLEFFQTQRGETVLYFIKLSHQDGNWALLDMHPRLANFDRLRQYLERSRDIHRLVVYVHHKFAALRDALTCGNEDLGART